MDHPERLKRLKWLCRRGMKELDVLLENFLQRHGRELSQGKWPEFEALLDSEDDQLWDWLQYPSSRQAGPYEALLSRIRHDRPH